MCEGGKKGECGELRRGSVTFPRLFIVASLVGETRSLVCIMNLLCNQGGVVIIPIKRLQDGPR